MRELSQNQQLMLFTEDSLVDVSHSVWRVKKKDGVTTDIFGQSFRGWSKRLDQIGSLLKTYLESCQLPLMTYVRTWSTKATASGFGILKLRLSVPRIGERVFFVAHSQQRWQNCMSPSNTDSERFKKQRSSIPKGETFRCSQRNSWRKPQPRMGGDIDGLSTWLDGSWDTVVAKTVTGIQDRVARIRALGNAVVPQQAYPIFKAIREIDGAL